jgi:hypothetical protein
VEGLRLLPASIVRRLKKLRDETSSEENDESEADCR